MTDSAYADFNKYKLDKEESEILDEVRNSATKGDWDEVSKLFSEMPGLNSPKGFISSKDLLHIIDAPEFAQSYGLDSSLQYIFNSLHNWVYPGGKEPSENFFEENKNLPKYIYMPIDGGLRVWPREFNERGRKPEIKEEDIRETPSEKISPIQEGEVLTQENIKLH